MMIRDVRLVYAPANSLGDFGGDIDNYEWPRHVGDYSFLRAYVGKDGRPAEPSPDNVPYKSRDFLVVSAEGLKNGDPVLLAGTTLAAPAATSCRRKSAMRATPPIRPRLAKSSPTWT